jgi:uncharacterized protein (DUF1778 family)
MSKTITLRVDDDEYLMLKKAADGAKRTMSNFLEVAAMAYITQETYVSDEEMKEILGDKELLRQLRQGEKEIKEGKYRIVG